MSNIGIYVGTKVISAVESKGKKLSSHAEILQVSSSGSELEDKVPVEVKDMEISGMLKDELRRAKIEIKDCVLALSGKDIIVRTFEVPAMPADELKSAVIFEAKKYIPFKAEDLIMDYQVDFDKTGRTNHILFTGIRKDTLNHYFSLFKYLNIKLTGIEYAGFSVLRLLKAEGLNTNGVVGVLCVDLSGEEETSFIVTENDTPLFSRDVNLVSESSGFEESKEIDSAAVIEKLQTETRVSLDYFSRKFPQKNIQKLFIVASIVDRPALDAIISGIGLNVEFVDLSRSVGRAADSSSLLKGFGASLSKTVKLNVKTNLLLASDKAKVEIAVGVERFEAVSLLQGVRVDFKALAICLLICLGTFGYGIYRMQPVKFEIASIVGQRPAVSSISPELAYEELEKINMEYNRKIGVYSGLINKQLFLTKPLSVIPRVIPQGVWLKRMAFSKTQDSRILLNLEGTAYLADNNREFQVTNDFLTSIKGDPDFTVYFDDINLNSVDRGQWRNAQVTNFAISCVSKKKE